MQSIFNLVTVSGTAAALPAAPNAGLVAKIFVQVLPGATGQVKIGDSSVTIATSTPGVYLNSTVATNPDASLQPGASWSIESQCDVNTLEPTKLFVIGSHAGDKISAEYHQI